MHEEDVELARTLAKQEETGALSGHCVRSTRLGAFVLTPEQDGDRDEGEREETETGANSGEEDEICGPFGHAQIIMPHRR
jgi:hypothetical protein